MFPVSQRRKRRRREVKPSPTPITQRTWEPRPAALTMTSLHAPDHSGVLGEFCAPNTHSADLPGHRKVSLVVL